MLCSMCVWNEVAGEDWVQSNPSAWNLSIAASIFRVMDWWLGFPTTGGNCSSSKLTSAFWCIFHSCWNIMKHYKPMHFLLYHSECNGLVDIMLLFQTEPQCIQKSLLWASSNLVSLVVVYELLPIVIFNCFSKVAISSLHSKGFLSDLYYWYPPCGLLALPFMTACISSSYVCSFVQYWLLAPLVLVQ